MFRAANRCWSVVKPGSGRGCVRGGRARLFALAGVVLAAAGCAGLAEKNYRYMGETSTYQVALLSRPTAEDYNGGLVPPHFAIPWSAAGMVEPFCPQYFESVPEDQQPQQTIAIVLNRCFLKYLAERGKPEVLAFVEAQEGEKPPTRRIFFRDDYQPSEAMLNFHDTLVYGPKPYSGLPVRLRFFVYELDGDENEVAKAMVDGLMGVVRTLQTPYGVGGQAVSDLVGGVMNALISTNVDDREFYHEVTLHPVPPGYNAPLDNVITLRTGTFAVVKRELLRDAAVESLIDFRDELKFHTLDETGTRLNIACFSGELYARPELKKCLYEPVRQEAERNVQRQVKRLENLESSTWTRRFNGKSAGAQKALRDALDSVNEAVRRAEEQSNPYTSGVEIPADDPGAKGLKDLSSPEFSDLEPYRAKSYLTFSVLGHLVPESAEVLNDVHVRHAKEIDETLNANLNLREMTDRIVAIQEQAQRLIVARAAERVLRDTPPEKRGEAVKELEKLYPEAQHAAIGEVQRYLEAKQSLAKLTAPDTQQAQAVLTEVLGPELGPKFMELPEAERQAVVRYLGLHDPGRLSQLQWAMRVLETRRKMSAAGAATVSP